MTLEHVQFAFYGFALGLVLCSLTWVLGWWRRRELQAKIKMLQQHLQTQMEITHEGAETRKEALGQLRQQNENLRVTLKALQHKPGRRELRQLHVYDHAVRQLLAGTPGFSMAWEAALKQAELHHAQVDQGLLAFARRLILPSTPSDKDSQP